MVVDDSLTVRKISSRFLEREGFRVVTARDGVEALEILEEEMPIAMLLDISGSMLAEDFQPNRIKAAKAVARPSRTRKIVPDRSPTYIQPMASKAIPQTEPASRRTG